MLESSWALAYDALGLGADPLNGWQMALRALVVFFFTLVLIRMGDKRLLGKSTAFDFILTIILGSVVSRGITGGTPFIPTLIAGLVLVLLHWLLGFVAFRSDRFGDWIKGTGRTLVKEGEIQWDNMAVSHFTEQDLLSAVRLHASVTTLDQVQEVCLERGGDTSVILAKRSPTVLDIQVAEGVQTVRVRLE